LCVCVVPYSLVPCVSFLHVPPNSHTPSLPPSVFAPNQQILDNVEVQHRLMEEMPILGAIPGFLEVKGRRLGPEEVRCGGKEGREGGREGGSM
jgi:hypothetical protein